MCVGVGMLFLVMNLLNFLRSSSWSCQFSVNMSLYLPAKLICNEPFPLLLKIEILVFDIGLVCFVAQYIFDIALP